MISIDSGVTSRRRRYPEFPGSAAMAAGNGVVLRCDGRGQKGKAEAACGVCRFAHARGWGKKSDRLGRPGETSGGRMGGDSCRKRLDESAEAFGAPGPEPGTRWASEAFRTLCGFHPSWRARFWRGLVQSRLLDLKGVEVFRTLANATRRSGFNIRPKQVDVGERHYVSR